MKRQQIALGLVILTCVHAAYAKTSPIEYVQDIAKQIDYVETQNKVWPGFRPGSTPSIIQFEDENKRSAYAINFKPSNESWKLLTNTGNPIYFMQNSSILNNRDDGKFATIDGQNSFMLLEDVKSFAAMTNLMNKYMVESVKYYIANESQIDPKHIHSLQIPYDNFNNATMIKLVYLEDAALTLAQQDDSAAAEDALRDAVAIHQYRNQLSSQSAREYENANEILRGIPIYISWTSKQLSDQDYRKMTQRTGCMPLNGMTDAKSLISCSNLGFPPFVDSVLGHALDKKIAGQEWKKNVETQFKSISQMAIDFYHFSDEQAQSMAKQAMTKPAYHYDRIKNIIDHNMQPYLDSMHAAVNDYKSKSGIEFRVPAEYGQAIMLLGMFKQVFSDFYLVDSATTLFKDINIDLPNIDLPFKQDGSGEHLILDHLSYMTVVIVLKDFSGEPDSDVSFTGFKLSDKAELIIDGKAMLASDFVRDKKVQTFDTLIVIDTNLRFPVMEKAKLDASDGVLKLKQG